MVSDPHLTSPGPLSLTRVTDDLKAHQSLRQGAEKLILGHNVVPFLSLHLTSDPQPNLDAVRPPGSVVDSASLPSSSHASAFTRKEPQVGSCHWGGPGNVWLLTPA